ncbi:MAG: PAS domain S-box protein, partial [bacterium]
RTLYESAPIGIEIYDISGSLIRANAAALAIFGLASEEPIKGFDIFADPNISADHKAMLLHGETIKYAAPFDFERVRTLALYPTTMRGIMELEVIIQPLAGGGYQVLVQDITARRRMEVTLLESEDKYRALIEKSHDIIYTLTAAGVFTFVSPAWTAILGHPINQVVGQSFQQFVHPDDIPGCMVWLQKMIETGQRQEGVEYRVRHTDGAWRWHTSSAVSLRDKAGKVVGLEGTARDITELRQAEVALEESKALVDAVVENIPLMIFLKEATDLRFVIFNRAGEELLGYDRKSLLGKNNMDLFPPEQAANFMVKDREVLDGNAGILDIPEEPILTARKGQRLLHTRKVCIRGADGVTKFLLGISEDITEQKKAEAALIKVKEDAVKANLAKSEFLAAMSHELRTPLNPVLGFAELLAVAPNLTDEQREWVAIIRRRGKDLLSLIGSVLDLSRIESEKLVLVRQSLALRTMMRDMIASIVPAADKRDLFLELEISPEVPEECLVDGFRLRQIILNLLTNAIKFTDTGGISVGLQDGRAARLCRPPAMDEAALLFSIQDTGIGIPENRQLAIFEPFTQVDSKHAVDYGGGAGLGLS